MIIFAPKDFNISSKQAVVLVTTTVFYIINFWLAFARRAGCLESDQGGDDNMEKVRFNNPRVLKLFNDA